MNILNNGIVMAPGKELDQYAKARGLCRLCGQTQTHQKVGRFLKKLRNGWEPLTIRTDRGSSYLVYKGHCIQPTCYSLEQAKRRLGELPASSSSTSIASRRSSIDDSSTSASSWTRQPITRPPRTSRTYKLPSHPASPLKTNNKPKLRAKKKDSRSDLSTASNTSASYVSDDASYWQHSLVSGLTVNTSSVAQVPTSIQATIGNGGGSPPSRVVLPVQQVLDAFCQDSKQNVLNLSTIELFEPNIGSALTALRTKKLSSSDGNFQLEALLADKCQLNGNRLVKLMDGLIECQLETSKLTLRANGLTQVQGLTQFLRGSRALQELNLSKNRLGDAGAAAIFQALAQNNSQTTLTKLQLARNQIWTLSDVAQDFLQTNQTLTCLNLEHNFLRDAGVGLLCTAIAGNENTVLEQLSLGNNAFGYHGAEALAELLMRNQSLHRVGISGNEIGDAGVKRLSIALETNQSLLELSGLHANRIEDRDLICSLEHCLEGRTQEAASRIFSGGSNQVAGNERQKSWNGNASTTDITFCPDSDDIRTQNDTPTNTQVPPAQESALLDSAFLVTEDEDSLVMDFTEAETDDDSATLSTASGFGDEDMSIGSSQYSYPEEMGLQLDSILPLPTLHAATSNATGARTSSSSKYRAALDALDLAASSQHQRFAEDLEHVGNLQTVCLKATGGEEEAGFETIAFSLHQNSSSTPPKAIQTSPTVEVGDFGVEVSFGDTIEPSVPASDTTKEKSSSSMAIANMLSLATSNINKRPSTRFALELEIDGCKVTLAETKELDNRESKRKRIKLRKRLVKLVPLRRTMPSRPELEQRISELDMTLIKSQRSRDIKLRKKLESERTTNKKLLEKEMEEEAAHRPEEGAASVTFPEELIENHPSPLERVQNRSTILPMAPSNHVERLTIFQAAPLSYVDQNTNERHILPLLDFEYESRVLKQSLKDAESVGSCIEIEHEIATTDRLSAFFAQGGRRLLHLSCHGHPDWLALENGFGDMQPLFVDDLRGFIEAGGCKLDFVFISACHSLPAGTAFLRAGVPHVVCARQDAKFRDEACAEFARCFYRALACHKTLKQAFKMAKEAVRVSPLVKDAKMESDKFLLLPERGEDDSYHDVPIFFTDDRSGPHPENSSRPHPPVRFLQRVPVTFVGREAEMYRVLEALRCTDLVQVCGGSGTGKATLVASVTRYIRHRQKAFMLDDVLWLESDNMGSCSGDATNETDPIGNLLHNVLTILGESTGSIKTSKLYKEIRGKLISEIHRKRLLLVIDARSLTSTAMATRNLEQFLKDLLQACSVKIMLIGSTSLKSSRTPSRTVEIGPLDFETSACLFARLVHSGRFSAPELASILAPKKAIQVQAYPLRRNTLIFEKIGRGLPTHIGQAAADMSEKDLLELVRIAQRPCPQVSTRAALDEEIQKRLSEEAIALRRTHYLRARDLRDLIDELQGLRQYFPTVDELTREISSLQQSLGTATKTRNYDSANNIQKRLVSVESQIEKENQWKENSREERFEKVTARARTMRKKMNERREST